MSNGFNFIYVVDAHFIDKIGENNLSWTQVPVLVAAKKDDLSSLYSKSPYFFSVSDPFPPFYKVFLYFY
jgi:hypothetical protein